ncbi:TIM barrel protein [Nanoarchaeota archaeon]
MLSIGPAGLGSVKDAIATLEMYKSLGFGVCEIAFTYGIYIKRREDAEKIGRAAKKLNIDLTIHAQYWINLNSAERPKVEASKQRILRCLEVGTWLGAKLVVFHPGYYSKMEKTESYENIKREILELQKIRKEKKYTPKLAPETTGKVNVFGSIDEIKQLVEDTGCVFCIDFAHLLARYKSYKFDEIKKKFGKYSSWHVHFSGIEYGDKGEKHHVETSSEQIRKLLDNLPRNKKITIISEAPNPVKDAVKIIDLDGKK